MPINAPHYFVDPGTPLPDYDRCLIAYSTQAQPLPIEPIARWLQVYGAQPYVEFAVQDLHVAAFDIANREFSVEEAIAHLRTQSEFDDIVFEADQFLGHLAVDPGHPIYSQQWALDRVEVAKAWQCLQPTASVVVAVVDSGAQAGHVDLNGGQITPWCALHAHCTDIVDDDGHGTMVLGTIAAISGNGIGIDGVASLPPPAPPLNLRTVVVKINDVRTPPRMVSAGIGIFLALLEGAAIINLSWHVLEPSGFLRKMILVAESLDVLVVVAAGNQGEDNNRRPGTYPASYPGTNAASVPFGNVISVMASDEDDHRPGFSNYGANVHVAAPGTRIASTGIYYTSRARYPVYSGTSAAAPHVTAAATLLLAAGGSWTPLQIRQHLITSSDPVPELQGLCQANGRLNVHRAVCPLRYLGPAALTRRVGDPVPVQWELLYSSPVIQTVEIVVIDAANTPHVLTPPIPVIAGNMTATPSLPATPMSNVVIRIHCREMPSFFADSAPFNITL